MEPRASAAEERAFLLKACAWQESLLQSYRTFHVTIQGFLIGASSAVFAIQLAAAVQDQPARPLSTAVFNSIYTMVLALLFWLQVRTAIDFRGVVESRAKDINYWHKITMLKENALDPSQRSFTAFKAWQLKNREVEAIDRKYYLPAEGVSDVIVDELIGKGTGHTRRVIDLNLFRRLRHLALSTLLLSGGITSVFWVLKLFPKLKL